MNKPTHMTSLSKCPVCHEPITLPAATTQSGLACPACGVRLTASEVGELVVEAIRPATTSNVAAVPKPPPKLDDAEDEDEWDEEIPRRQPWRRRYSRAAALKKVKPPAIFLQVLGVVWIVAAIATVVISLFVPVGDPDYVAIMCACIGGALLGIGLGAVTFLAGMRMKALQSYSFVLAVIIVTMVVGVLTCIPLAAIPIWPLVVLVGADVRAGFEMTKQQRANGDGSAENDESVNE
jgi:hypothetical protein